MSKAVQIHSRCLTVTIDYTNDKGTVQWTTKSEQAHVIEFFCFCRNKNHTTELLTLVVSCIEPLNEAHRYVCLELFCKNNVTINPQLNEYLYWSVSGPFISVNQQFICALSGKVTEMPYSFVISVFWILQIVAWNKAPFPLRNFSC
jgi:hypothetical protein